MRTTLIAATSVACLLVALAFGTLQAQQAQQPPASRGGTQTFPNGIAVIDIARILDNYAKLKKSMDSFKADFEQQNKDFQGEKDAILKAMEQLKAMKAGTQEFKTLEEQIAKRQSNLQVKASLADKDFNERRSRNYYLAYKEVEDAVKGFSQQSGISAVVRYNGGTVDATNYDQVRAEVFKTVQYYDSRIDITDPVLAILNRNYAAATANQKNAAPQPATSKR